MSNEELKWLIATAKDMAHKDWCLSVPREAKAVIAQLVEVIEGKEAQP